jgi:23S rRNA (pseudouridine1915-N3)-methyltransferase
VKICFLVIGKTTEDYLKEGIAIYEKRLKNYISFDYKIIPELKKTSGLTFEQQKVAEGKLILESIAPSDYLILMDERGKSFTSVEFATFIQKQMLQSIKTVYFVIGGPYGFSAEVYNRANDKISLSAMTLSHQMVRLFFVEQLYRSFTILKNEPYHH